MMDSLIGANPLGSVGTVLGIMGAMMLVYWTLSAWRDARDAGTASPETVAEGVGERFSDFVIAIAAVTITIGDQLIAVAADLVGMVDSPMIVGHAVGGLLGWLGLEGLITPEQFLLGFAIVTVFALIWRATSTRGRGV